MNSAFLADLAAAPPSEVIDLGNNLAQELTVEALHVPRSGLAMVAMRDAVFAEPFHLGEIPLATAAVHVTAADGRTAAGGAALLSDREDLVIAAAICSAVLDARLPGWEAVQTLVASGAAQRQRIAASRAAVRQQTRVDFSELTTLETP